MKNCETSNFPPPVGGSKDLKTAGCSNYLSVKRWGRPCACVHVRECARACVGGGLEGAIKKNVACYIYFCYVTNQVTFPTECSWNFRIALLIVNIDT